MLIVLPTGLQAKEKREKKLTLSPQRPPTRRGHRPPDVLSAGAGDVSVLQHALMPGTRLFPRRREMVFT